MSTPDTTAAPDPGADGPTLRADSPLGSAQAAEQTVPDWWIYRCVPEPHDGISRLPDAPPWRSFAAGDRHAELLDTPDQEPSTTTDRRLGRHAQAASYRADRKEIHLVNMALMLRRPLLVTGPPGVGKSTLAYSIARELRLGPVLRWSVTSRTTLQDGQYHYDAIGRLQEVGIRRRVSLLPAAEDRRRLWRRRGEHSGTDRRTPDIGQYLRLGPLGTAFLPWKRPRVLLIDEIDKSDVDFPNDLLHVFEEGEFGIVELARQQRPDVTVMTADEDGRAELHHGRVRCHEFPVVVMTSNGEREFPPAFLRRCVRLEIPRPGRGKLARLLAAHLPAESGAGADVREELIARFLRKQSQDAELANDQLLNAVRLAEQIWGQGAEEQALIEEHLLRPLNGD
jgi:MoxR-like ATPase